MYHDGQPFWENPLPLWSCGLPRIVLQQPRSLGRTIPLNEQRLMVSGTSGHFGSTKAIKALLRIIESRFNLDSEIWKYQNRFLADFFRSYYLSEPETPAWITLAPKRLPFIERSYDSHTILSKKQSGRILTQGTFLKKHLGRAKLLLNGVNVPTSNLVMEGSFSAEEEYQTPRNLKIQKISIKRTNWLSNLVSSVCTTEYWYYFGCPAQREEREQIELGLSPTTERFRIEKIQNAPLISLCRMRSCEDGHDVENRCFSLSPNQGRIVDFRDSVQSLEYYCRTDENNHAMLWQSTSRTDREFF